MTEQDCYLGFSLSSGIGPKRFDLLLKNFGSAKSSWFAGQKDLERVIGKVLADKFIKFRDEFDFDIYNKLLNQKSVFFISRNDKYFPSKLKDLQDCPIGIFCKGNTHLLLDKNLKIAIVGTRKITSYGKTITKMFTADLVNSNVCIVSGLALGVDGYAHEVCLDNHGNTIAVLGNGVDFCFPTSNQEIYDSILLNDGLIISEYPLSVKPTKGSFPARNRIIAALSEGLLVPEGASDSGSLITARIALSLKRKVFAVPGPVNSVLSKGPLKLIKQGATLVTDVDDIFDVIGIKKIKITKELPKGMDLTQDKIIKILFIEKLNFDQLKIKLNITTESLSSTLSVMEIEGFIKYENDFYELNS